MVLLVVGVALLFVPFVCFAGVALGIVGFILLLVGVITEPRPAVFGYPPQYMPPQAHYPPQPAQMPPVQPGQPVPMAQPTGSPHCPRCGQPLQYVYQYQRWYCPAENVYPWG